MGQLEERVSALEAQLSAAAGAPSVGNTNEAPIGSPTSGLDADTSTTTTPAATDLSGANNNPQPQGAQQSSYDDNQPIADDENEPQVQEATERASEVVSDPVLMVDKVIDEKKKEPIGTKEAEDQVAAELNEAAHQATKK